MVTQRLWLGLSVHKYVPYLNPFPMLHGSEHRGCCCCCWM